MEFEISNYIKHIILNTTRANMTRILPFNLLHRGPKGGVSCLNGALVGSGLLAANPSQIRFDFDEGPYLRLVTISVDDVQNLTGSQMAARIKDVAFAMQQLTGPAGELFGPPDNFGPSQAGNVKEFGYRWSIQGVTVSLVATRKSQVSVLEVRVGVAVGEVSKPSMEALLIY